MGTLASGLIVLAALGAPARAQLSPTIWKTDLNRRSISLSELREAGPPKDGIPALESPLFDSTSQAAQWLVPGEPVIIVEIGGEARAYPLQILLWHELVNDDFRDVPILVSYCPLCNSSIVFDRRIAGRKHSFGVTGFLRANSLVMYDRETESLWQQVTGEAIVGGLTGTRLEPIASRVASFAAFTRNHPDGRVLSRRTGYSPGYGRSTYVGYEHGNTRAATSTPLMRTGDRLQRVITVRAAGRQKAYSLEFLRKSRVVEDRLKDVRYVIFFDNELLSPLDSPQIAESRSVGTAAAYAAELEGRPLHFRALDGRIVDRETGSSWDILGAAVEGTLKGKRLSPMHQMIYFEFAHRRFFPRVRIQGDSTPPGDVPTSR